jgi:NADPH:quinone reductase-like Zn-dependent oxidoreductase
MYSTEVSKTDKDRTMKAIVTTGQGGYEKLVYTDVPLPMLVSGDVLLQVLASSVNSTDINTRVAWYGDGGWQQATPFPLIQGTDCCGRVVAVTSPVHQHLMGRRVLVRPSMRPRGFTSMDNVWLGADFNGAFAQFVKVPATEVFPVNCDWSDAELGTLPCAFGTAENMLHRADVVAGEHVVVTGASGGVGSAVVQLAKRRSAFVTAICGRAKMAQVEALGADRVLARDGDELADLPAHMADLVVDNVAGPGFALMLKLIKSGGRYVTSGAIAGAQVSLDLRALYLNNISLLGCTAWAEPVFPELISAIERGEIQPCVAKTFPLEQMATAQREFLKKEHCGKFALIPPEV